MMEKKLNYKSKMINITNSPRNLDTNKKNGLECVWSCQVLHHIGFARFDTFRFTWYFNWDELKAKGIDRLSGYITLKSPDEPTWYNIFPNQRIDIDLRKPIQVIERIIKPAMFKYDHLAMFEYSLTPHYTPIEEVKEESLFVFTPSEQNDAILVVDGNKIPVNKAFLSCHSEYFHTLFSWNDNDGKVTEIPIEGIPFNDFKLLLDSVSPNTVFPTDETVDKLLELATRFKMPSVIRHCEHHLIHLSKIENAKKMLMAEKYGMSELLEKSILEIDTIEKAKKWKQSPEYNNFSNVTKARVLDRLI